MSSLARDERDTWQAHAACQGQMGLAFYPPLRTERRSVKASREERAKEICQSCPVQNDCLDHALTVNERYGIWGGLTENERKHLHTHTHTR